MPPLFARMFRCPHESGGMATALQIMPALIGRLFQIIGLILLPIGLMVGLLQNNVALEVRLLFIGGASFVIGWLMARRK